MKTITVAASKAEEIAFYNDFLKSLGAGTYLHSMFARTGGRVEQQIRNDIAFGVVEDVIKERDEARQERDAFLQEVKELVETRKAVDRDLAQAQRDLLRIRADLQDIKKQARRLAD